MLDIVLASGEISLRHQSSRTPGSTPSCARHDGWASLKFQDEIRNDQ
jgi:hypothetical protein